MNYYTTNSLFLTLEVVVGGFAAGVDTIDLLLELDALDFPPVFPFFPFCGDAGGFSSSGSGNLMLRRISAAHSTVLMQSVEKNTWKIKEKTRKIK